MPGQKTATLTGPLATRRNFLKTAGAAAATLVGGLGARRAVARTGPEFSALPPGFVYLNSGTEGSMPDRVIAVFQEGLQKWASDPTTSYETDPVVGKHQVLNRSKVAAFLGTGTNNICLTDNTTMGLSMTLTGLDFRRGDRVIMTNHEHTAIRSPLAVLRDRLGIEIETRPFPPTDKLRRMQAGELFDALFPDTPALRGAKALCVSHVYPTTGTRLPLGALREKADALNIGYLVVDGAQAMGMVDLTSADNNIDNCDFYACPGHKWLNGPPGTGILYLRNGDIRPPEFYPMLSQRMEKYAGCDDDSPSCFPVAEALQVRGCSNAPGFAAMMMALDVVTGAGGPAAVEQHIMGLSRAVKKVILDRAPDSLVSPHSDAALASGLTAFYPFNWHEPRQLYKDRKTADWVVAELLKNGIQVRSIGFANAGDPAEEHFVIRVSTSYFNTSDDVATFATALKAVLARVPP